MAADRGVRVEVERPVQREAEPERAHISERDGQPDRPTEPAVKRRKQSQVHGEGEAVDQAEAQEGWRDQPGKPQRQHPDHGRAEGTESVGGRLGVLGGHVATHKPAVKYTSTRHNPITTGLNGFCL